MPSFKLQTNVPVLGTVQAVYYAKTNNPGQYQDQVKLRGQWDTLGAGDIYLGLQVAQKMSEDGLLTTSGQDKDGNPAYRMLYLGRVKILRVEDGNRKVTTVTPESGAPVNGAPAAPLQTAQGQLRGGAPPAQPSAELPGVTFARLKATLAKCLDFAKEYWKDSPPDVIQTTAHTLFIAADRRNCLAPAPPAPPTPATAEQKDRIDELQRSLEWDAPTLVKRFPDMAKPDALQSVAAQAIITKMEKILDELLAPAAESPSDTVPW